MLIQIHWPDVLELAAFNQPGRRGQDWILALQSPDASFFIRTDRVHPLFVYIAHRFYLLIESHRVFGMSIQPVTAEVGLEIHFAFKKRPTLRDERLATIWRLTASSAKT